MKDYHINVFYSEEDEGYLADIPDFKFCSAFGKTPEEAVHEVQIAKSSGSRLLRKTIFRSHLRDIDL